jgi:hypothetical protein
VQATRFFAGTAWPALVLTLVLIAVPNAAAAPAPPSTYGYYGQQYMTTAFNYFTLAYDDAPVGSNGMMHKTANGTCMQCHAGMANAPAGNSYAFEAYLYAYYASQYAATAYRLDVQGNKAAAKTYYYLAYTYGGAAWDYGAASVSRQFFNKAGATDAATGTSYANTAYQYCYYAYLGK